MSTLNKPDYVVRFIWAVVAVVIAVALGTLFASCNPVKKVLKDPFKMQQVFDEGVKMGWCVNDSVYISDTAILLDTLHVIESTTDTLKIDSVIYITKTDYKTITKTVTIRDTAVVIDNSRINLLQKQLIKQDGEIIELDNKVKEANAETKNARRDRNKWRLYFFLLLAAFGVWLFRKPIMKLIKPI